jgi:hypothetical protein
MRSLDLGHSAHRVAFVSGMLETQYASLGVDSDSDSQAILPYFLGAKMVGPSTYDLPLMLGLVYVPALVSSVASFVRLCSVPYASLPPALFPEEPRSVQQRAVRCSSTSVPLCCGSTVTLGVDATLACAVAYRKREDYFWTFVVEYCCDV